MKILLVTITLFVSILSFFPNSVFAEDPKSYTRFEALKRAAHEKIIVLHTGGDIDLDSTILNLRLKNRTVEVLAGGKTPGQVVLIVGNRFHGTFHQKQVDKALLLHRALHYSEKKF